MWTWGRAAFSALSGGGQSKAGVAYKSSQPATEAAPTSSAENAAALMSNQDSIDILDPSAVPDQSSAPEAAQSDASMGGRPSAGCVMENNGNGGAGNSSAEPANGCVAGVLSAREQVLLCASDELECLFQRLGVEHFPVLECVCSTWRKAIRSARMLGHEYLLYPNEAYPLPRTPGGIVSPSAVCVLPNGELVVTDTGTSHRVDMLLARPPPPAIGQAARRAPNSACARRDPTAPCARRQRPAPVRQRQDRCCAAGRREAARLPVVALARVHTAR